MAGVKLNIGYTCSECHETTKLSLDREKYEEWTHGALIQNVFPNLTEDQRELMISGICGKCFDSLFYGEDEQ